MKNFLSKLFKKILSFFPKDLVVFVYNLANKIYIFEILTNSFIKKLIPEFVETSDGKIYLNKDDVGVSGHIALGKYEKTEVDLFRDSIKQGMNVVDVGANIGYYSVIAGKKIGSSGKLFVYEPEETNMSFLKKNISANNIANVFFENVALSSEKGEQTFFLTKHNKGTHSLVNNRNVKDSVVVQTDTLDSTLEKYGSPKIDIIKMDIEGAEILAIEGMNKTIERSENIILFTEFYPLAMRRLGKDPVNFLNLLKNYGFKIYVIDEDKNDISSISNFEEFVKSFPKNEFVRNIYAIKKEQS